MQNSRVTESSTRIKKRNLQYHLEVKQITGVIFHRITRFFFCMWWRNDKFYLHLWHVNLWNHHCLWWVHLVGFCKYFRGMYSVPIIERTFY